MTTTLGDGRLRPAMEELVPLASVGPHGRRPDGRTGQPPTGCVEHFRQRPARGRQESPPADASTPSAGGTCSRWIAKPRITSTACSSSRARRTIRHSTWATAIPTLNYPESEERRSGLLDRTRTTRSSSATRRSTATDSAATARSSWAPRGRWCWIASRRSCCTRTSDTSSRVARQGRQGRTDDGHPGQRRIRGRGEDGRKHGSGQPWLHRRNRALGLVHSQQGPGEPAPLQAGGRLGRLRDRPGDQCGDQQDQEAANPAS